MTLFEPEQDVLLDLTLDFTPKVKERPRANTKTGAVYTPTTTKKAEADLLRVFLAATGGWTPIDRPIDVRWEFANDHTHLVILTAEDYKSRKLRGDLDNYMKLGSDALNGAAYVDDRLIVATQGRKL